MKIDGEVANLALEIQAIDDGIKTAVSCIDKNLEVLDQCVNCRHQECECAEVTLVVAEGKIEVLEEQSNSQCQMIVRATLRPEPPRHLN